MKPINISEFDLETLKEYASWWGQKLKDAAMYLRKSDMEHFSDSMAAVIGLITLYDIYLQELDCYNLLKRDKDNYNYYLDFKDYALETIEKMEDWLYGTERLREPYIGPSSSYDREF